MEFTILAVFFFFFLVTPSLIFRRTYYFGKFSVEFFNQPTVQLFSNSIIPGLILHTSYLYLVLNISSSSDEIFVNLSEIYKSIDSNYPFEKSQILQVTRYIFFYNFFLWVYSFVLGLILFHAIRFLRLDRKVPMFRFKNMWNYVFSGEYLDFNDVPGNYKDVSFTWVDVVTRLNNESIIYSGIFIDYKLEKNSYDIASVTIHKPLRRFLFNSRSTSYRTSKEKIRRDISGHQLIIPSCDIINMNISYYHVSIINSNKLKNQGFEEIKVNKLSEFHDDIKRDLHSRMATKKSYSIQSFWRKLWN